MIHGIQRAHGQSQLILILFPALMMIAVLIMSIVMMIQGENIGTVLLTLFIAAVICYAAMRLVHYTYKQVFYDNDHIYIKSIFGKPEDTISYDDVIRLSDYSQRLSRQHGGGIITLSYRTAKGHATIKFAKSFPARSTELLKRQISPEKVIE